MFILGSGSSLTQDDVELLRGRDVIAVNNAYQLAPWAKHLHAGDWAWWKAYNPQFDGQKWTISRLAAGRWGATWLNPVSAHGLSDKPGTVAHGFNSGYQAINLAYHLGYSRVILLGYDCGGSHWFGDHQTTPNPKAKDFARWIDAFNQMDTLGMEVLNASRDTALTCFYRVKLEDVL